MNALPPEKKSPTAAGRGIVWHQRLWVRIYLTLVVFTVILAAIGLTTWEVLNDLPGAQIFRTNTSSAPPTQADHPQLPPDAREGAAFRPGPPPSKTGRGIDGMNRPPDLPPDFGPTDRARPADAPKRPPTRGGPPLPIAVVMFIITSLAILIVAYPIARRLARSIERIAVPVNAFGQGELSARAPTDGPGEVGALGREFNLAADRVQALIRSQQSLLANASHELRSPLARIQMQLEDIGVRSSIDIRNDIRREIAELDELVEEILLSSRLQSANRPVLTESIEMLALVAEECARVGCSADGVLATVHGDMRLLRRVIRNMLENAVRYSGSNETVTAQISARGGWTTIDVLDRGPGVAPAERERIFEPFYRARGAREKAGGVGLGLALARQIAVEHGGTLECLPREGGGGHFRLTIPCIDDALNQR